ncbi:MAG: UvrD-helicase domain-containing protein, partial [Parasporobacterium sp.]|nr:UvrD-helicase domain-containing protein [Parasporobacterium sp.]
VLQEITELSQYSFDGRCFFLNDILENWSRLSSVKKKDEVSEDLKKQAQTLYGELREGLSNLKERFFYQTLEEMYLDMGKCAKVAKTIMELTLEFSRRFAEEKKARLIADFNDVAHFALGVLMQRDEDGNPVYTAAADSIAKATREIIIDEYQDTNRMQDALIGALSAERFGRPNVFMVGDVKQSIYGFRLACPDLFIEKYNEYQDPSGNGRRIILGENYRSRKEIVDFINLVFEKIMLAEVGGIDYLDGNIMICGASFPEPWDARQVTPEILFVEGSGDSGKDAESFLIAEKIEEITESYYVTGKDGTLRKARYSDIAILTRKTNNPRLEKMLTDRHIPVKKSSSKGFFGSFEIRLAMDLLKVIDNPLQDIPLAAVLLSPVAGLDANTLARIKISSEKEPFCLYSACLAYSEDEEKEGAKELREFLSKLKEWRGLAEGIGINSFLNLVLEESGLYDCSAAMTYGEGRTANLDFLKNLASGFSKGSYRGLFNFIRYIDAIQKADQDFGSGQISGNEDAVTLMTIHKSKGLEFPVVILADCGKTILDQDSASPVYLDDVLGLGIELRDLETRIKRKTLLMETIAIRKKTSLLAEEIRLLYVAMSRAKEKLIITGAKGNLSARRREWENPEFPPDAGSVRSDNSYMYLLGDAMRCEPSSQGAGFVWTVQDLEEVEIERAAEIFNEKERRERVREMISRSEAEQKKSSDCKEPQLDVASTEGQAEEKRISPAEAAGIYDYEYPWLSATRTNVKVTASQMENHESDRETKEETYRNFRPEKEAGLSGAERGNAYHKLFELLDYHAADKAFQKAGWNKKVLTMEVSETETLFREAAIEFALSEIERLKNSGHLSQKAAKSIVPEKIADFLLSELGGRMREAALSGNLRREQQFVMAAEIDGNPDGLMQGIIDAFFIEDKNGERRVILVDYKTDRRKTTDDFVQTYQGQQEGYARALEAALGIPVTERLLYSVELNQVIRL